MANRVAERGRRDLLKSRIEELETTFKPYLEGKKGESVQSGKATKAEILGCAIDTVRSLGEQLKKSQKRGASYKSQLRVLQTYGIDVDISESDEAERQSEAELDEGMSDVPERSNLGQEPIRSIASEASMGPQMGQYYPRTDSGTGSLSFGMRVEGSSQIQDLTDYTPTSYGFHAYVPQGLPSGYPGFNVNDSSAGPPDSVSNPTCPYPLEGSQSQSQFPQYGRVSQQSGDGNGSNLNSYVLPQQ